MTTPVATNGTVDASKRYELPKFVVARGAGRRRQPTTKNPGAFRRSRGLFYNAASIRPLLFLEEN